MKVSILNVRIEPEHEQVVVDAADQPVRRLSQ